MMALGLSAQPPSHPRTVSQPPSHPRTVLQPPSHPRTVLQPPSHPRTVSHPTILTRQLPSTFEPRPLSPATQVPDIAMPKELSVGSSFGAASMLFVYVASALLPGAAAALPIMMSSLPIMSSLENCKKMTLDFVIRDNNVQMAAVEDDIVRDLAKIGIEVKTRALDAEAYTAAEYSGDYHMMFGKTWGAPYDPHSYLNSWKGAAHAESSALGGLEPPLTKDGLMAMINDAQIQTADSVIAAKWEEVHQAIHSQATFLPLWGTRVPYVLNRRFTGFTPSTQMYTYPIESLRILSGSRNVTVAAGTSGGDLLIATILRRCGGLCHASAALLVPPGTPGR